VTTNGPRRDGSFSATDVSEKFKGRGLALGVWIGDVRVGGLPTRGVAGDHEWRTTSSQARD